MSEQLIFRERREEDRDAVLTSLYGAKPRSPAWRALREKFVKLFPSCKACGRKHNLEIHHLKPFHLFPELELSVSNLVTLCADGPAGANCHMLWGHGGDWRKWNPSAEFYIGQAAEMLKSIRGDV